MTARRASRLGQSAVRTLRRPYRYAIALVLACVAVIALALLFLDKSVSTQDKLTQIGSGLAASIIFALIYTVLANREYAELIQAEIASQLSDHVTKILNQMGQLNQLFLPTDQYPPTREFDVRFNRDLTRDLCASSFYFFRGTSAKYLPGRLRTSDHGLNEVQVVSVDPRNEGAVNARASDRRKRTEYEGKKLPDIAQEIKDEILSSVVALFDCRDICSIDLGFVANTSPVRMEIFDNAIYISLYRVLEPLRTMHPATARFGKESQTYQIFRDECRRQLDISSLRTRFKSSDTDSELLEYLSSLGYREVDAAVLDMLRAAHHEFIAPFTRALQTMGT